MTESVKLEPCPNPWCNSTTAPLPCALSDGGWRVRCACGVATFRYDTAAEAIAAWNRRHQPQEREAVLEEALRKIDSELCAVSGRSPKRDPQAFVDACKRIEDIAAAALTTPAPAAESDWFAGDVDCDGNELVTIRADELQKLRDEREKFMWQVRDTCTRAEKAEAALAATPAVSTDEIDQLVGYAAHDDDCAVNVLVSSGKCSCGLTDLLSRLRGEA